MYQNRIIIKISLIVILQLLVIKVIYYHVDIKQNYVNKDCLVQDERAIFTNIYQNQRDDSFRLEGGATKEVTIKLSREAEKSYCVPKKLHFIWLGKEIPKKYRNNIKGFTDINTDYQVILWAEKITKVMENDLQNVTINNLTREIQDYTTKDLFDKEANVGAKSDILRYEIVYKNGGVYFDTDSVCDKPLNDLLTHSFVSNTKDYRNIQNSVFGFPKGSEFLDYVIRLLRWNINMSPDARVPQKTGPPFFTGAFVDYNDSKINMISQRNLVAPFSDMSITHQTMDATWVKP